jgi:hypothetical protein
MMKLFWSEVTRHCFETGVRRHCLEKRPLKAARNKQGVGGGLWRS